MAELRRTPGTYSMLQLDVRCASTHPNVAVCTGVRSLQQARRSRSFSRLAPRVGGRVQRKVWDAQDYVSEHGLALEPATQHKAATKKTIRCLTPRTSAPPQTEIMLRKQEDSEFKHYYKSHFHGNSLCNATMQALYNQMQPDDELEQESGKQQTPLKDDPQQHFQANDVCNDAMEAHYKQTAAELQPTDKNLGSNILTPAANKHEGSISIMRQRDANSFSNYYKQHFLGNSLCEGVMASLYGQMANSEAASSPQETALAHKLQAEPAEIANGASKLEAQHGGATSFRYMASVGTWLAPRVMAEERQQEKLSEVPLEIEPPQTRFSWKPSVGSWVMPRF